MNILAHIVERISASLVVGHRLKYLSLHGTTLTREWMLELHGKPGMDTNMISPFVGIMTDLLEEVYWGRNRKLSCISVI